MHAPAFAAGQVRPRLRAASQQRTAVGRGPAGSLQGAPSQARPRLRPLVGRSSRLTFRPRASHWPREALDPDEYELPEGEEYDSDDYADDQPAAACQPSSAPARAPPHSAAAAWPGAPARQAQQQPRTAAPPATGRAPPGTGRLDSGVNLVLFFGAAVDRLVSHIQLLLLAAAHAALRLARASRPPRLSCGTPLQARSCAAGRAAWQRAGASGTKRSRESYQRTHGAGCCGCGTARRCRSCGSQ